MSDERKNLPQAARTLIATARNDITIPRFTSVMQIIDDTLIARGEGKGLKIYDEIERDTHAYAVLQKRKFALIARDWQVEAASSEPRDIEAAEFVEARFEDLNFDQLCLDLLDATLKGYAVAEIVWKRDGVTIVPERIVAHEARRFTFSADWQPRLLTFEAPLIGIELPERKFIVHRFGAKGNNPFGLGLGSKLFWPVLFKREGVAFWLTFLEKFASPTPVGKYPIGMLPEDQRKLLDSLEEMRQAGALVVPIGTDVTFLEATRAGQVEYADWCKYWDTQISLCVFGSNLATQIEVSGSRAAAEIHKEAEEQIIDADADLLADTLGQTLIAWLVAYNMPGARAPVFSRLRPANEMHDEDLRSKRAANAKAELDLLFDVAGRVPPAQFAKVATALADHKLLPEVPAELLQALGAGAGNALLQRQIALAGSASSDDHDHGAAAIADDLARLAESAIAAWLQTIRGALDEAVKAGASPADFAQRLLELDPDLVIDPLGNVMAGAVALSELRGRADVAEEQRARRKRRK